MPEKGLLPQTSKKSKDFVVGHCYLPNKEPTTKERTNEPFPGIPTSTHSAPSWTILGPSWDHFELSWAILGPSWDHFGTVLNHLGPSWGHRGTILDHLGPWLDHLGTILRPSWPILGHLGPPWTILGQLGQLGPKTFQKRSRDWLQFTPKMYENI
jgi:hypothetical protein